MSGVQGGSPPRRHRYAEREAQELKDLQEELERKETNKLRKGPVPVLGELINFYIEPEVENCHEKPDRIVVISSKGGAARHQAQGGVLGQFEYDEGKESSTDQSNEKFQKIKLFSSSDVWQILVSPSQKSAWLKNPTPSKTVPSGGWLYHDGKTWQDDPTLTISPGPLSLARQFTVTATGAAAKERPAYPGVFTRTERWWHGRPVYTNTQGRLLHHGPGDNGWMTAPTLGKRALSGSQSHHSPAAQPLRTAGDTGLGQSGNQPQSGSLPLIK